MYNIATGAGKTTVQLDPLGGSENFHSGPGGWMSGTGYGASLTLFGSVPVDRATAF